MDHHDRWAKKVAVIKIGDTVELVVTKVSGYACWGTANGKIGFSHCVDWSEEKPVPPQRIPAVGEVIKVRVFRLSDLQPSELPPDVSFGGMIAVDFAGSRALVDEESWKRYHGKTA